MRTIQEIFPQNILDQDVTPTDSAGNLGVEYDKDFDFKKHISNVCRLCNYHNYTPFTSLAQMFNSGSDEDNCNVTCVAQARLL